MWYILYMITKKSMFFEKRVVQCSDNHTTIMPKASEAT